MSSADTENNEKTMLTPFPTLRELDEMLRKLQKEQWDKATKALTIPDLKISLENVSKTDPKVVDVIRELTRKLDQCEQQKASLKQELELLKARDEKDKSKLYG